MVRPPIRSYPVRRYYDPATGQFISVDPLVDQTEAPYSYAGDDPSTMPIQSASRPRPEAAPAMARMVNVLTPPFLAGDRGDIYVFADLNAMYSGVEAYDAPKMDLFDATGRPLRAVVDGYSWTVDQDQVGRPDPERLESILQSYFARLPEAFSAYSARAAKAANLNDLVRLRQELAHEPAPGIWAKLFRRSWG
ncbi:MAG TPA: hypothetical protein VHZ77_09875 [Gaiellaceae bacterium]|jgi:hypothetical protein|nr:hypothetical protein [Gaiellaceae bacterium]